MRIPERRKTTTAEGVPEGLPEATNSKIGVFRTMTSKTAAKERDQSETESNGDRGAKTGEKRARMRKLEKTRH